jgi:outer membrane protein OmpA-like peptidoglycan-associated protein
VIVSVARDTKTRTSTITSHEHERGDLAQGNLRGGFQQPAKSLTNPTAAPKLAGIGSYRRTFMKISRLSLLALSLCLTLGAKPGLAAPDEYDDSQSHPLRVAAYLLHPVGWITEWIVFRPFHFMVSATKPQEVFFGHHPHPPVLGDAQSIQDYGMPKRTSRVQTTMQPQPPATAPAPPPETVKIVEVPVEKIVVKEVRVEVEKLVFPSVAFAFDSARLTDLGKGQVYMASQRLREKTDVTVVIEGHADSRGDEEYNRKLGLQRAQTIMNELAALGVDRNRMSTASVGESQPALEMDTAWARAVNRRVEFQVKAAR